MTASSSVMWTWSPWMTATCTTVVTNPATLLLLWTSSASGEGSLRSQTQTFPPPPSPSPPHHAQALAPSPSVPLAPGPWASPYPILSPPSGILSGPSLMPALPCHRLPYAGYFGGVSGLSKAQFLRINGFPNEYWGWGGEDDDIFNR